MTNLSDATFWEHLSELRNLLVRVICVIAVGLILSFSFYQQIFQLLSLPLESKAALQSEIIVSKRITNHSKKPITYQLKPNEKLLSEKTLISPGQSISIEKYTNPTQLVLLGPTEGMVIMIKVSFWVSLILTSPVWLYMILNFLAPALNPNHKKLIIPFALLTLLFFGSGTLYGFTFMIPLANSYLGAFNETMGNNLWSLANYLDYSVFLLLASGLVFELCAVCLMLVHFGIFSAQAMKEKRRHLIVLAFIIAALLTPPDVLTQILLAVPLIILYETCILYALWKERKGIKTPSST